ncbi:MAG: EAL domain-containing protein [Deltaproteobacteria bacterium]|nr:EAL domain-containing protein [Deltaproteobacteria bacterium]
MSFEASLPRILVVDDNEEIHRDYRKVLDRGSTTSRVDVLADELFDAEPKSRASDSHSDSNSDAQPRYSIDSAFQGREALERVVAAKSEGRPYAVAFVDMRMPPGWDGMRTIEELWKVDEHLEIVICTAFADYSWEDLLRKFGARDQLLILKKPFDIAEVSQLASALSKKWTLARAARLNVEALQEMVRERTVSLEKAKMRLERELDQRRALEECLRTSETRYAIAAQAANDGLWDWDLSSGRIYYSTRWKSLMGCADHEIGATKQEWLDRVHPADLGRLESALETLVAGTSALLNIEYRMRHRDGQFRWMLTRGMAVAGTDGKPARIAGSQSDITSRRAAEDQLKRDALRDALTGLPNRTLFVDRLQQCILSARRTPERYAVLFLDLDRFKGVNDSLGHVAGDQVLIAVADRLKKSLRVSDSVGLAPRHSIARLGGDEFLVLLRNLTHEADALRVAERILEIVGQPVEVNGQRATCPVSIGIAYGSADHKSPEEVIRDADTAMYHAKASGAGKYALFEPRMHEAVLSRWRLENDLRHAIEREELLVVYQPIVDTKTGHVVEVEALMRWKHATLGFVSPLEFIPLAEETGLILPIGRWILEKACAQCRVWVEEGKATEKLKVAINVSARQLASEGFAEEVAEIVREARIGGNQVRLEITESVLLETSGKLQATMPKLRNLEIDFHLDDFGTGYSSLRYLQDLPVEALKIDRTFVSQMLENSTSLSIVRAIIALAHALDLRVVAEGVETKAQLECLQEIGCDFAQGYYFARPLPAEEVGAVLSRTLDV